MNNITRAKVLVIIIIFLLITNIGMLLFFISWKKPVEKRQRSQENKGMYNSLQKEVGFSDAQLGQYQALRKGLMKEIKPLFNEVRKTKNDFYGLIFSANVSDSVINAEADSIAQKQKLLDLKMFYYFKSVRNICVPAQKEQFDSTIKKELRRMTGRQGKRNKDHKK